MKKDFIMEDEDFLIFRDGILNFEDFKYNFLPNADIKKIYIELKVVKLQIFIQLLICFLFRILLLKKNLNNKKIKIIYSQSHEKILSGKNNFSFLWGRKLFNYRDFIGQDNPFNYLDIKEYIIRLLKNYKYLKNKELIYYLEYLIFYQILEKNPIEEIWIAGHQDRIATWCSLISKKNKIKFNISQHGIMTNLKVPKKIYVDKVEVYNEYEKKFFEKYLIDNSRCNYVIKGLEATVNFKISEIKGFKVGFFSQYGETENTIRLVNKLNKKFPNIKIIVSPHPRENIRLLKKIEKLDNVIISNQKYINLDIIISYRSTIIYDYLSQKDFKGAIISYPLDFKHEFAFNYIPEVKVLKQENLLIEEIDNEIKRR